MTGTLRAVFMSSARSVTGVTAAVKARSVLIFSYPAPILSERSELTVARGGRMPQCCGSPVLAAAWARAV